jgi:hypothetical protein
MKTGGGSRYPSKISLLKDLARAFWRAVGVYSVRFGMRVYAGNLEIVKELKEPLLLSNS